MPMPPGVTKVNGITDEMIKDKPRIEELPKPFADILCRRLFGRKRTTPNSINHFSHMTSQNTKPKLHAE